MDIYQIFLLHNRMWSKKEIIIFSLLVAVVIVILAKYVRTQKVNKVQAIASLGLVLFLGVVFASTVFTRSVTTRQYELIPFWSWKEVIVNHDKELLQENLLNCILLLPVGMLIPIIRGKKVPLRNSFLTGFVISASIEICQLIFQRGLFEWDDVIHNGLGCVLGTLLLNYMVQKNEESVSNKKDGAAGLKMSPPGSKKLGS